MKSTAPAFPSLRRPLFALRALLPWVVIITAPLLRATLPADPVIGLSQYSLRELIKAGTLDPLDYPAYARAQFGLTQLDLWEGGLPADRLDDMKYLAELRARASSVGTCFFLLMAGILDATGNTRAEHEARAAVFQPSIERAVALGCDYLRIFVKASDGDRDASIAKCAQALGILADLAKQRGITIVIEPGASKYTKDGGFLAAIMRSLRHGNCKLMPDFGKLGGDVYEGTRAMMPYTAVVSAKTHNFDAAGNQIEFDYERLMRIIKEAGFRGIVAIEWEGKGLTPDEGVLATKKLIEKSLAASSGH